MGCGESPTGCRRNSHYPKRSVTALKWDGLNGEEIVVLSDAHGCGLTSLLSDAPPRILVHTPVLARLDPDVKRLRLHVRSRAVEGVISSAVDGDTERHSRSFLSLTPRMSREQT